MLKPNAAVFVPGSKSKPVTTTTRLANDGTDTPTNIIDELCKNLVDSAFITPHPSVNKRISAANSRINKMSRNQLTTSLSYLELSTKGTKEVLKQRLKSYSKNKHLEEFQPEKREKTGYVDYYVVIDFEATCEPVNPLGYLHEIIEFPAVIIDAKTDEIVSEFHEYCRPVVNPYLTDFCKELTGITQTQVDCASSFPTILKKFDDWIKDAIPSGTFCVVTDGPWDMNRCLKNQCLNLRIDIPHYFHRWVNVRKHFLHYYNIPNTNLEMMLKYLGLEFEGRQHSGIDDSRNIARILIRLKKDGADVVINESFR